MIAILPPLIESLRNELQQYGEMLALLEAQQEFVSRPDPIPVLNSVAALEAQSAAIHAARSSREQFQRQLAWAAGLPEGQRFEDLLPLLPGDYRPLVDALVQEINQLLERVRERARLNLEQLRQGLELMQRFLAALFPEASSARLPGESDSSRIDPPPSAAAVSNL
jgi:flagellar FlgN protein